MVLAENGMTTKIWIVPYKVSSIDKNTYIQSTGESLEIMSVPCYEDSLVRIILPQGDEVIVKANQIITAVRKCIL